MSSLDWLTATTIFFLGLSVGAQVNERVPKSNARRAMFLPMNLMMSSIAIGVITRLTHFDADFDMIASWVALSLALAGLVALFLPRRHSSRAA